MRHATQVALLSKVLALAERGLSDGAEQPSSLPVSAYLDEARYRRAACLLADTGWRAHPEYRGTQSLNIIAHGSFIGVDHPGRAFLALTNLYRHEGIYEDVAAPEVLARRHAGYRNRVLMGPSFRADVWTALDGAPDMSIADAARTGKVGDGKVFVHPLEQAIRIRTQEVDDDAL